ncbi:hypothetical protein [Paenibacillus taiwanensis]|uniref:hypothetical protein n=1 Tax=Paenibacillus taiwanensis TaxID=401638 RepID=UPI00040825DC|nr:hypothetical protein [Paenibacillus taiwanensis]
MLEHEAFWRTPFATISGPLDLPTDFEQPEDKRFNNNYACMHISPEVTLQLREWAPQLHTTLFTLLLELINPFLPNG